MQGRIGASRRSRADRGKPRPLPPRAPSSSSRRCSRISDLDAAESRTRGSGVPSCDARAQDRRAPEHLFPADEWRIVEARWTPDFAARAETALALSNGYLGVRGVHDEGRPASAPGVFVNGFHETWPIIHAEDAYGLARVGQTIVNVPDATIIELYVDDEPLFVPTARTPEYRRVLDMRNGVLTRELLWATPSGKHARVRSTRLVSFEHRHVVAMSYEVTLDRPAPVCSARGWSTGRTPGATARRGRRRERSAASPGDSVAGSSSHGWWSRTASDCCSATRRSRAG